MKKPAILIACALLATSCQQDSGVADNKYATPAATNAVAADETGGNVLAVVNGVEISTGRITLYAQGTQINPANRDVLVDNIITSELISQAAKKAGIAERAAVREELAIAEQTVLGRAYVTDFFENNPVADDRIDALYQEISAEAKGQQEYNVAHILVEDEALANDLLKQIQADAGAFEQLAGEHSQDPGSGSNGGRLGWMAPHTLVPEFSAAMQELDNGAISSAPVKTTFGWHIIRVDERRDIEVPPLSPELRERILQSERADMFTKHIEQLRAGATIELR